MNCGTAGTFATDSDFSVCLGPVDAAALEAALLSDPGALLDAFASIDVTQAQAGHPEDQSRIMGAVEALPGGAPELDGLAMRELTKWALGLVRRMVAARRDPETGALLQQEQPLKDVGQLAEVLRRMGEVDAARKLFEQVIEGQTAQLSGSHTGTLTTKGNLANLQRDMGEVDVARKLFDEVIEGQTAQLGGSHTGTLITKGNLAVLLQDMGEVDAARKLYEEVIEGRTAQLGGSHTSTLTTKGNLALLMQGMGEVDAARKLYEEVIEGRTAQLGGSHTSTLGTKGN
eukprot:COSAG06_NODE_3815_length_4878_cov_7.893933_1_plen_286_part_10